MPTAGEVLRRCREAHGLTQADVAAALRVSDGIVSQWEIGRVAPRQNKVMRLDDLLGADGAILAAYGYASELTLPDDALEARLARLEQQADKVAGLRRDVTALARQVRKLTATIDSVTARTERRSRRRAT